MRRIPIWTALALATGLFAAPTTATAARQGDRASQNTTTRHTWLQDLRAQASGMSGRARERFFRAEALRHWRGAEKEAPAKAPIPRVAGLRASPARARAGFTPPPLNRPMPIAGEGNLSDSGRIGIALPPNGVTSTGPGVGTLNGLGNGDGGTGIGSGSTGTGVGTGTNPGADIVRPVPVIGKLKDFPPKQPAHH